MNNDKIKFIDEMEGLFCRSKKLGREIFLKYVQAYWYKNSQTDWYDHRMHIVYFDHLRNKSSWIESIANVTQVFPMGGKLLDMCSGDAWFSYNFICPKASKIVCIENGEDVMRHATKLHKDKKIEFRKESILDAVVERNCYDVVWIRGAIEHFSLEDQNKIAQIAYAALKPNGYYCGDTPAKDGVALGIHEFEWSTVKDAEDQMKMFKNNEIYEITDVRPEDCVAPRKTIFWRCQK